MRLIWGVMRRKRSKVGEEEGENGGEVWGRKRSKGGEEEGKKGG